MQKVNLVKKLESFKDYLNPKIVGELNGQHVKLVKVKGEFVWHHHETEDELFYVLKGELIIKFKDEDICLNEGEFLIVPHGIEHKPVSEEESHVLLFEPATTVNTGNVKNARTVDTPEFI